MTADLAGAVDALRRDLADVGRFSGHLQRQRRFEGALRLLVARPGARHLLGRMLGRCCRGQRAADRALEGQATGQGSFTSD